VPIKMLAVQIWASCAHELVGTRIAGVVRGSRTQLSGDALGAALMSGSRDTGPPARRRWLASRLTVPVGHGRATDVTEAVLASPFGQGRCCPGCGSADMWQPRCRGSGRGVLRRCRCCPGEAAMICPQGIPPPTIIAPGPGRAWRIELRRDHTVVGRGPVCDMRFDDQHVGGLMNRATTPWERGLRPGPRLSRGHLHQRNRHHHRPRAVPGGVAAFVAVIARFEPATLPPRDHCFACQAAAAGPVIPSASSVVRSSATSRASTAATFSSGRTFR
jgi:hypothetical protein